MQAVTRCPILALLCLSACHDFEGERGRLGFLSNLRLSHSVPWTPDHPIAAGTFAEVLASSRLDDPDSDQPLDVQAASGSGLIAAMPEHDAHVAFTGEHGSRGMIRFWGERDDHFSVRFAAPAQAHLIAPLDPHFNTDLAFVPGEEVVADVVLRSAAGEALGFDEADLQVTGQGAVSAWLEEGLVHLVADGEGAVRISLDGGEHFTVPVRTAEPEEIVSVTLSHRGDGSVLAACLLDDGTRLLGAPVCLSEPSPELQ